MDYFIWNTTDKLRKRIYTFDLPPINVNEGNLNY